MSQLSMAIARMLEAFGASSAERAQVYVEALREEHVCEACGVAAARTLARRARRRPVPVELVEEARQLMGTGVHAQHVPERAQLRADVPEGYWARVAPAIVHRVWPELTEAQVEVVCRELQRQASADIVQAREDGCLGVGANLGEPGSTERAWWGRFLRMQGVGT